MYKNREKYFLKNISLNVEKIIIKMNEALLNEPWKKEIFKTNGVTLVKTSYINPLTTSIS